LVNRLKRFGLAIYHLFIFNPFHGKALIGVHFSINGHTFNFLKKNIQPDFFFKKAPIEFLQTV